MLVILSDFFLLSFRHQTIAERLMAKDEEEQLDYTFPLSMMVKESLEEVRYQTNPLTSSCPPIKSFRGKDYLVSEDFSQKPSKLDDDVTLLTKPLAKAVVSTKLLEELEKLSRQAILVGSHAEWVLGSAVALMESNDVQGVVRAIESINIAQRHNAALLSRLLANLTYARREQCLATASLSSVAKNELFSLPIPLDNKLFQGQISPVVSKDAETTSKQALVSLAGKLQRDKPATWSMPSFKKEPRKPQSGGKSSFRKNGAQNKNKSTRNQTNTRVEKK